ncbi:MAG: transposase zinc-binding domain-containing protein, partial [Chromatiaceae bacterium]
MNNGPATSYEIAREFPPEPAEIRLEVADVFRAYGAEYREKHDLSAPQLAAMEAIESCRTTALGGHVDQCEHCGHIEISYNSCRNRNCPKCRGSQRAAWVDARELELLPIQYFHLVFTLTHTLLPLARYNPDLVYGL